VDPVIQPYEDYGIQKYVEWTPNPNQQFEIRASTSSSAARRARPLGTLSRHGEAEGAASSHARIPSPSSARSFRALIALWLVSTVVFVVIAAVRRSGAACSSRPTPR
jgi:hypothetical protein